MKFRFLSLCLVALLAGPLAIAQPKPVFEVATVKISAPLDMAKLVATVQAGQMPRMGAHIDGARAEYTYMTMREIIAMAYRVQVFQISGPDWITKDRFDIVARLPDGATKADTPKMLQALLEERFKISVHRTNEEHPVLALVVAKGGHKLKASAESPKPLDENEPLKPGQSMQEGPDGPIRISVGKQPGTATVDMGAKGTMSYGMNPATQSFHMDGSMITMSGFADMLTQFSQAGGAGNRRIVDMTNLPGAWEVSIDFSIADLLQIAKSTGMDIPAGPGRGVAPAASPADAASDPSGAGSSIITAVQNLGLRLESRKTRIEQLVIDHVERTPTEN